MPTNMLLNHVKLTNSISRFFQFFIYKLNLLYSYLFILYIFLITNKLIKINSL